MSDLCTKTEMLKLWRLVTFEPLKVEQSYIPLLKALMCGINAVGAQGCSCMSTFCHAPLKIALLLHKMANGPYSLSETVSVLKSTRHFFWLGHQNAWKKYLNGTKSIKNTLKFIFHLWKTVTRWRCSRKIWRNILKTAISPLLNHFHRWYGYQNKRDSSSIVHALAFCAQIGLHFNKVPKTSKKHAIFDSF